MRWQLACTGAGIAADAFLMRMTEDKFQKVDDAEIAFAELGHLILLKIRPYKEATARYFIFNEKLQTAERVDSIGQSYDLCGPKAYTMLELAQFVARTTGHDRLIFGADELLTNIMAVAMECLPGKLMSLDNVRSMTVDSVCSGGCTLPFGIAAASVEATAPAWLGSHSPRGRYALFRDRTRRAA